VDYSLLVALALGVAGVLVWTQLRRKEKMPRCPACKLDMERDAAILDPDDPTVRHPMAGSMIGEMASTLPYVVLYHCPRCGRRVRRRR
jgi:hypothetical protein